MNQNYVIGEDHTSNFLSYSSNYTSPNLTNSHYMYGLPGGIVTTQTLGYEDSTVYGPVPSTGPTAFTGPTPFTGPPGQFGLGYPQNKPQYNNNNNTKSGLNEYDDITITHAELKTKIDDIKSEIKELEDNREIEEKRLQMLMEYKTKRLEAIKNIEAIRLRHLQLIEEMTRGFTQHLDWLTTEKNSLRELQDISKDVTYPCSVCQIHTINRVAGCGHPFCHTCVNEVQKRSGQCPICKKDLAIIVPLYL
eukprot:Pompholyxophrys_sp_v1_NODE_34_length_3454_cov_2.369520.p3 type:complete len:249 gc:universal NODE_34_length_3454_cov_2.369520:773-1519(+)